MDVTTETVAPREVEFTIHPEAAQVEDAMLKAARRAAQRVRIPGFRPGKAPYAIIERTVGRELLTEEAAEILAPDLYKQIMEQGGYEAYDRPTLRISQQEPLELKLRVALEPEVTLADYCSLRIEPEPEVQVSEEQVDKLLQEIRESQGTWVPVERPAQLGDQVTLDIKGTAGEDVVFDETGTTLALSEALAPPGFAEAVAGAAPGEAREFTLTYPEDRAHEDLAGKTVLFAVTVHEVKERRLPALDDDMARAAGDFASLDELRERVREGLTAEMEAEARDRMAVRAVDELVERSTIEYPAVALEREIDRLVQRQESRLRQQGFSLESFMRLTHKTPDQLREELRPTAEKNLRRSLVVRAVGRAEKIEVSPEELQSEVQRIASPYGEQASAVAQALMQPEPASGLVSDIISRKAVDRLIAIVTGKAECAPPAAEAEVDAQAAEGEPGHAGPPAEAPAGEASEAAPEGEPPA